ncbi:hypothetical protein SELMODRAFT_411648 [Selaginella moellendorffii]|uniref:Uncharacterized protein n=1 Tax=Selaginella moellendorffii TaxID=88036 RepID=D8RIL1_SELML|nr:uncharacterized protein LOC9633208 [Selaginella moellendorffii]EFJ28268.1 hypothetical protein SELMODRAFT_411648 [Selaginella moellendorffii]|eukprot:XP_002970942.1 uncharacterized protein LOC9633208 [Selaginella moellendorffii]
MSRAAMIHSALFLMAFVCCFYLSVTTDFDSRGISARKLLAVTRPCPGCVSFPRNVPNFRTRFRHQQRIPPRPRRDHPESNQLVGRKMLEYQAAAAAAAATVAIENHHGGDDRKLVNVNRSSEVREVHQIDHPDRYVPGGPDPLHHRSTPPSMLIPDLN